jgi:hypothetical protein
MALNFGQIRERYESATGTKITTSLLASYIDEAQLEIAQSYGPRVGLWYPQASAYLTAGIDADTVIIPVDDVDELPEAPDEVMIGIGPDAERISYTAIAGLNLTGVTRSDDAVAWPVGTAVTLVPESGTEYDLPDDILERLEVRDEDGVDFFDYQVTEDNIITFFEDGPHKLIYTKIPDSIDKDDPESEPEVNPLFHRAIVKYCIAQYWEDNADGIPGEEQKATKMMAQFYSMVERVAKKLRSNPNQQHQIGIKLWS